MFSRRRAIHTGARERGRPTSSNGASSTHLIWTPGPPLRAASVTLEILEAPLGPDLYFWAMQVSFAEEGRVLGGAHLGLQWYRPHPGGTAVNWGGYRHGGGELPGTMSALPSATGNPNTRDLAWVPRRRYRLTVQPAARPGWWAGIVTDLDAGASVVVRELAGGGDTLTGAMVWGEVFAPCDAPPTRVRWSDPGGVTVDGLDWRPAEAAVNYQRVADGGCSNGDVAADGVGIVVATAVPRSAGPGTRYHWPHFPVP